MIYKISSLLGKSIADGIQPAIKIKFASISRRFFELEAKISRKLDFCLQLRAQEKQNFSQKRSQDDPFEKDEPLANLPASADDVFIGRELSHPHRPSGVQLLRADADLAAESKLAAVAKARRGIGVDDRAADFV